MATQLELDERDQKILIALELPGATASSVAADHGLSRSTVERIKAKARKPLLRAATTRPTIPQAPTIVFASNPAADKLLQLVESLEGPLRGGVKFLEKATKELDPGDYRDVRAVGEAIVRVLGEILRAYWVTSGKKKQDDKTAEDSLVGELSTLSDEDLRRAAVHLFEGKQ